MQAWIYIVKFRCSNHKLAIETGRYVGIDRNLRYCDRCTLNVLRDEYHAFCECNNPDFNTLRQRLIQMKYRTNCSMYNFVNLLNQMDDIKICSRISLFIKSSNIT